MKCPKCGYMNDDNSMVCNLCGEIIKKSSLNAGGQDRALICNAFPPIFIKPNTQYTIGRERSNSIVLVNDLVSRFHSCLIVDNEGAVFAEDRGSRNGTLVNGVRIRERTKLKIDDKVTVGSYNIFYKNLNVAQAEQIPMGLADGTTLALGALGGPDGMVGSLSHMSMTELFTTLEYNAKTGLLSVSQASDEGKVFFRDGNILQADFKGFKNLDAVYALLRLKEGVFEFVNKDLVDMQSMIPLTTQQILLEYARNLDERHL